MTEPRYNKYTVHDTWGHRLLRGLYSSLVPGAGQLVAGAAKRGYAMVGVVVAVLVAVVLVVLLAVEDVTLLLVWLISPSNLLGLLIADILLLLFRVYAVADAVWLRPTRWASADKRGSVDGRQGAEDAAVEADPLGEEDSVPSSSGFTKWRLPLAVVGLAALFTFTVLPHVWVGYNYVYKFRDVLGTVFAPETTTTTLATTTTLPGTGPTDDTIPANTTTTLAPVTVDAGDDGRLTILFIGADIDETRRGYARNDTTIVASFDLGSGRIALFSFPRNAGKLPLGEKGQEALGVKAYPALMNEIYGAAWKKWPSHPSIAPEGGDPGAEVLRETTSLLLGIPVDYYAVVDMLGLVKMVDVMGGVKCVLRRGPSHGHIVAHVGGGLHLLRRERRREPSRWTGGPGLRAHAQGQQRLRAHGQAAMPNRRVGRPDRHDRDHMEFPGDNGRHQEHDPHRHTHRCNPGVGEAPLEAARPMR